MTNFCPNICFLFYACWDTPSENNSLWHFPRVSSAFNLCICFQYILYTHRRCYISTWILICLLFFIFTIGLITVISRSFFDIFTVSALHKLCKEALCPSNYTCLDYICFFCMNNVQTLKHCQGLGVGPYNGHWCHHPQLSNLCRGEMVLPGNVHRHACRLQLDSLHAEYAMKVRLR